MEHESIVEATLRQLEPVPTPEGVSSREVVRRAIEFEDPPRIPYYFLFHPSAADMVAVAPPAAVENRSGAARGLAIGQTWVDAWGVTWETTGRWWDHAVGHPLADLGELADFRLPDLMASFDRVSALLPRAEQAEKYVFGVNPVGMYETMRSLMGFEALMMAPHDQPDGLLALLDRLTEKTLEALEIYARTAGVHGFMTAEDWGLQTSLQMKVDTFREFYRPFYQRIIDACHARGMHFIWHNCGYIVDLFPDMIEMGVDVLQLDQPRLMGHANLAERLGGKICMWNTVDIQWSTCQERTDAEIREDVADMVRTYDPMGHQGGFIAKHYPQPWDIELSPARQRLIYDAFMRNGCQLD